MSKRDKNYPDPFEVLKTYGADALRIYLLSSPVVAGESLNFSAREIDDVARKYLNILWNVATFYRTYAGDSRIELAKPRSSHILDRWLYARLHSMIREVTDGYERYDLNTAIRPLRAFVDDLSTWWLRRSRDRMRGEDSYERLDALKTLKEVLLDLSALMAPCAPFIAERIYQDMEGLKASVHLEKWPKEDPRLIDDQLLADMDWVRRVASLGLERRSAEKMPVRQALAKAIIRMSDAAQISRLQQKNDLLGLLREELNVEAIAFEMGQGEMEVALDTVITPELKAKGLIRELVRHVMATRKATGLQPQDQIVLTVSIADTELKSIIEAAQESIMQSVKAKEIHLDDEVPVEEAKEIVLDGKTVQIALK